MLLLKKTRKMCRRQKNIEGHQHRMLQWAMFVKQKKAQCLANSQTVGTTFKGKHAITKAVGAAQR